MNLNGPADIPDAPFTTRANVAPPPPRPRCSRCGGELVPGHLVLCAEVARPLPCDEGDGMAVTTGGES